MNRRLLLLSLAIAGCSSSNDRVDKMSEILNLQVRKGREFEQRVEELDKRLTAEIDKLHGEIKDLRKGVDRVQGQVVQVRNRAVGPAGSPTGDVDAERVTLEELEYIKRPPAGKEEAVANAIAHLRPVSANAVPLIMIDLRQSVAQANLPVERALERVLLGLDADAVSRALVPELDSPSMRVFAAGILGDLGHTSARDPLARRLDDPDFGFRFAVAGSLVKLKGPEAKKAIPVLVEALRPEHRDKNVLAYDILRRVTGRTFGYRMYGSDDEKRAGAQTWQEWWEKFGDTFEVPD